jgi:hypothetical protein
MTHILTAALQRQPGAVMVDVGLNIGFFSLLAATLGSPTVGFDIMPTCIRQASRLRAMNGLAREQYEILHLGVYHHAVSNATIHAAEGSCDGDGSILVQRKRPAQANSYAVGLVSFDQLFEAPARKEAAVGTFPSYFVSAVGEHSLGDPIDGPAGRARLLLADESSRIGFLKLDCEGCEAAALGGLEGFLRAGRVENIFVEVTLIPTSYPLDLT